MVSPIIFSTISNARPTSRTSSLNNVFNGSTTDNFHEIRQSTHIMVRFDRGRRPFTEMPIRITFWVDRSFPSHIYSFQFIWFFVENLDNSISNCFRFASGSVTPGQVHHNFLLCIPHQSHSSPYCVGIELLLQIHFTKQTINSTNTQIKLSQSARHGSRLAATENLPLQKDPSPLYSVPIFAFKSAYWSIYKITFWSFQFLSASTDINHKVRRRRFLPSHWMRHLWVKTVP